MPVEEAVLDTPILDAGVDAPDTNVAPDAGIPNDVDPAAPVADVKGDGRTVKASWRAIQATHPDIFNDLKNTFFAKQSLESQLAGLNLDEMRPWLDENGGQQGINDRLTELAGKSEELDGLYQAINSGDASVVDRIPEEALQPIATAAFERFAQTQPDAWKAYQANVFAATINEAGVLPFLDRMEMMLQYNDVQNVPALVQQLRTWAQSFAQNAQAQPQQRAQPGKPAQKSVAEERKAWEAERATTEYSANLGKQAQDWRNEEISKHLSTYVERRKDDSEAKDAAFAELSRRVDAKINADEGLKKSIQAFSSRRDIDGAMRLIKSRETMLLREEAPKVGKLFFGQPAAVPAQTVPEPKREAPRASTSVQTDPKKAFLNDLFARA